MTEELPEGTKATAEECVLLLREVHDDETKREIIYGLRVESWKSVGVLTGSNFPADICLDEHDAHAMHWAIEEGGQLIAAARMCIHTEIHQLPDAGFFEELTINAAPPFAAVNRLVVHPDYQRRGLARKLDEIRIRKARALGCGSVLVIAPPIRWRPLEQLGFEFVGAVNLSSPPDWLKRIAATTPQIERRVMMLRLL
jgi:GNAT superfamily N-acetyltransferase